MTPYLLAFGLVCLDGPDDFYEPPLAELGGAPSCDSDLDCKSSTQPYCDPELAQCVECLEDVHCGDGWTCSEFGKCIDTCTVDAECDGINGYDVCDLEEERCVECVSDDDCLESEYCFEQFCTPDNCPPGELGCVAGSVVSCHDNGGTYDVVEECSDRSCVDDGDGPYCPSASTTGQGDGTSGGTGGGTPGGGTSSGGTVDDPPGTTSGGGDGASADGVADRGCSCRSGTGTGWLGVGWILLAFVFTRRSRS